MTFNAPPPPGQGWLYNTCYSTGQGLVLAGQIVPGFSAGVKAWQAARIGTSLGWQAAKSSFWKESGKSAVKSMAAMEVATAEAAIVETAGAITARQTSKKIILERGFNVDVDVDVLSRAGQAIDRNGLTKAGRALQKHGGRPGSVFPKTNGSARNFNQRGQDILDDILTHPNGYSERTMHTSFGEIIDIKVPNIGGARFTKNKEMMGLLEPANHWNYEF